MDEIPALLVEANRQKLKQDFEVSMKNTYLMVFPSYCLIHSAVSVTGFHNFLCRRNEASVAIEQAAGNGLCLWLEMDLSGV